MDAQAISISIQGTRITGRYEDVIREHINGAYLANILATHIHGRTQRGPVSTGTVMNATCKFLKGASLFQRIKFIHDWPTKNSSSLSPPMPRSGSALAARQLWKTMITSSDILLKNTVAMHIWRWTIFAVLSLKHVCTLKISRQRERIL